jgi:hypothetical protein
MRDAAGSAAAPARPDAEGSSGGACEDLIRDSSTSVDPSRPLVKLVNNNKKSK